MRRQQFALMTMMVIASLITARTMMTTIMSAECCLAQNTDLNDREDTI